MAMALRVVLNKAVGRQLKGGKLGFLGAISSGCQHSIVGHNSSRSNNNNDTHLPSSNCWCRHYYFLPSPPAVRVLDFPTVAGVRPVEDAETDDRVRKLGEFAVKARNQGSAQDGVDGGGEIQFVRPVRASFKLSMGLIYYITLEALRGKADMNVYYAEVLDCPDQNLLKLIKWEQVNESFSYPFEEIRLSKFLEKKYRRDRAAAKNHLVSTLLEELELRCRIPEAANRSSEAKFKQNWGPGMLNSDDCPPTPPENFDLWATFTLDIVPVFDIKTYEMVYEYAMFAIGAQFKNEDERVYLKDVLWASKSKDNNGWVYHIVLEAINGKSELDFYYAIVKASPMRQLELIKWHQIGESLRCPDEEEKRFDVPNYDPPPILAETPEIYD